MSENITKEFYSDCCWTAPNGVSSVTVYPAPEIIEATGINTEFLIDQNCQAYMWGLNALGMLGDGTNTYRCCPVPVCGGIKFSKIIKACSFTIGLTQDGCAYTWGLNFSGQLGDGTITARCCPVPVCGGLKFRQVGAGIEHAVGLTPEGCLYAWGSNNFGHLGDGTQTYRCCPVPVCGGIRFKSIVIGSVQNFALTCEGCAYAWGKNCYGEAGNGTQTVYSCCPVPVCGGLRFKKLVAWNQGNDRVFGLTTDGYLYAWGRNQLGSLGDGSSTCRCCPVPVCSSLKFIDVGDRIAIAEDRTIYTWGSGGSGILGDGTATSKCCPVPVCGGLRVRKLVYDCSPSTRLALTVEGCLYTWGSGVNGILGDGTTTAKCCPVPVCSNLKFVDANASIYSLFSAVGNNGLIYSWGANIFGGLGDGTTTNRCCPVAVCRNLIPAKPFPQRPRTFSVVPGQIYEIKIFGFHQSFNGEPIQSLGTGLILEYQK